MLFIALWAMSAFLHLPTRASIHLPLCQSWVERTDEPITGEGGWHASGSQDDLKRIQPMICLQRDGRTFPATIHAQVAWPLLSSTKSLS